ncbi:MAG: hypothetical protein V2A79_09630 [Planctomycetota bacterium]
MDYATQPPLDAGRSVGIRVGPRGTIETEPERLGVDTVSEPCFYEKPVKITGHAGGACPDV